MFWDNHVLEAENPTKPSCSLVISLVTDCKNYLWFAFKKKPLYQCSHSRPFPVLHIVVISWSMTTQLCKCMSCLYYYIYWRCEVRCLSCSGSGSFLWILWSWSKALCGQTLKRKRSVNICWLNDKFVSTGDNLLSHLGVKLTVIVLTYILILPYSYLCTCVIWRVCVREKSISE